MICRLAKPEDKGVINEIFDLYWDDAFREKLSEKLDGYYQSAKSLKEQNFKFVVVENEDEIIGVAAYRNAPEHMREFTTTQKPAELYVIAVKKKGRGTGKLLRDYIVTQLRSVGYTEVVFFSGVTHKDSWSFHDDSDFQRIAETHAPDGESGYVWSLLL